MAVTFLMVGVVGVIGAIITVLGSVSVTRNNLIGAQLAQEGIELVRNIRDKNWLSGNPMTTGFLPPTYRIEWRTSQTTGFLPFAGNVPLLYDPTHGYNYSFGSPTIFQRAVDLEVISPQQIKVIVTVTWPEKGLTRTVQAVDYFFDWY